MSLDSPHQFPRQAGSHVLDWLGIGFGPANIALAIALEQRGALKQGVFLERMVAPDWQGERLVSGAMITHPALFDLVTPHSPHSKYTFLSYLKTQGRLAQFLSNTSQQVPRVEYARYIRWAARHFDRVVRYANEVTKIAAIGDRDSPCFQVTTRDNDCLLTRRLVLGEGASYWKPAEFKSVVGPSCVTAEQYLTAMGRWTHAQVPKHIALVGGASFATDLLLDLASRFGGSKIVWITPHAAPGSARLAAQQYEWDVLGDTRVTCLQHTLVTAAEQHGEQVHLSLQSQASAPQKLVCDAVVLAPNCDEFGGPDAVGLACDLAQLDTAHAQNVFVHGAAAQGGGGNAFLRIARDAQAISIALADAAVNQKITS